MDDSTAPAAPPPGWYRDSPDPGAYRWWSGREWTEHRSGVPVRGAVEQPPLPAGTSVGTVWIWLLSLLPLLALAAEQPVLLRMGSLVREQVRLQRELLATPGAAPSVPAGFGDTTGLFALSWGSSLLLMGLAAVGAHLDWRALRARGVVRPFAWGWGFLSGVYIVGRSVVVRRRTGRGLAPLWVAAGSLAVAMVVQFAEFLTALAAAGALTPS